LLGMPNIANASVCILYSNIGNNNNASSSKQFSCNNQNQSDYNVGGRLGILLSETGKDTGSYIGIPSTIYEHSNLHTNTVIEIG
jgi:hypothetical protein